MVQSVRVRVRVRVRAGLAVTMVLFAAACRGASVHATPSDVVRSHVYGYRLKTPSGWSAVLADQRLARGESPVIGAPVTDVFARHATRRFRLLSQPALVVGAQPLRTGATLDTWTASITTMVERFKGCPSPASRTRTTVAGTAATQLLYPDCPGGSGLYHVWTVVVSHGLGYQFVWFDASSRERADAPILERVLSSVTFAS